MKLYRSRGWLWSEYISEGKSIARIAREQEVSQTTIRKHLIKNNIPIRKANNGKKQYPDLSPSPELAYILGVIDGDGCVSGYDYIRLVVKDKEFAEEFAKALKVIGLRANVIERNPWHRKLKQYFHSWQCYAYSVVFVNWYNGLIRKQIEGIAKQFPIEYLKGFFESEGSYTISTKGSANVLFSNLDYALLLMAQRLLTLLGYDSKIYRCKQKTQLTDREVTEYMLNLLGSSREKHEFIKKLNPCIKNRPYDYRDPDGLRGRRSRTTKDKESESEGSEKDGQKA